MLLLYTLIPIIPMVVLFIEHVIQYKKASQKLSAISDIRETLGDASSDKVLQLEKGLRFRENSFLFVAVYILLWLSWYFYEVVREGVDVWYTWGPEPEILVHTIWRFAYNVAISIVLLALCVVLYVVFAYWRKEIVVRTTLRLLFRQTKDDAPC